MSEIKPEIRTVEIILRVREYGDVFCTSIATTNTSLCDQWLIRSVLKSAYEKAGHTMLDVDEGYLRDIFTKLEEKYAKEKGIIYGTIKY